jgi:tRNA nucleotidyltransferase (CCA-adding enzyme)
MRSPQAALEALRADPCGARLLRAFATGDGVHLVGGAVRDLLLERPPRELDLVVDGDVDAAAARLGGEVTAHDRFGTALVRADGCAFDLVRARAESYAHPGALPEVRPGTLDEDLCRRDVTINAIALSFDGTLTAVPGALDDLRAGMLRVLHDRSFLDDPTRVWRVARYAARLGFGVEERTRSLAEAADPSTVSGDRLGAELRLALREPDPPAAFEAVRGLNPAYLPEGFEPRPRALSAALQLLPVDGRADLLTLAACTAGMDAGALLRWLDEMGFTAGDRDLVAAASRFVTGAPLRAARTNAEVARAARGAPVEAVALVGGDNARRWLDELRHVRLVIDGRDLLAAGIPEGPEIGARLQRTLDRKLDGEVSGREQELAAALEDGDAGDRLGS